jgi:hypothetical protein
MQRYFLFGWQLDSELPLPCLHSAQTNHPDCTIRILPPLEHPEYTTTSTATLHLYAGLETFWRVDEDHWRVEYFYTPENHWIQVNLTNRGRSIEIRHTQSASLRNLPSLLVSSILAPFLRMAGRVTLHGGVVNTPSGGVLLLGNSGAGKSSTLGALWRAGCQVVSDDIAVFEPQHPCVVFVGPRYLRLWGDTAQALGIDPQTLPLVFAPAEVGGDKRYLELSHNCPNSLELKRIIILAGRENIERPKLTRLAPKDAVGQLLRYPFRGLPISETVQAPILEVCVALAHTCAVYLLHTPNSLEQLPAVAQTILESKALKNPFGISK